jgi:periplasmic divalent cation tolerance protein
MPCPAEPDRSRFGARPAATDVLEQGLVPAENPPPSTDRHSVQSLAMARHYQVTTTTTAKDKATELSHLVVEQRLAACSQVSGPITSTYWWELKLETTEEWLCTFKTSAAALEPLKNVLRKTQGYMGFTTPEIVATPIEDGDADYLAWIDAETSAHSS